MKKKILIILGSFMLLSNIALSCQKKELHNKIMGYIIVSRGIYIKDGKLFILNNVVTNELLVKSNGDIEKSEEGLESLIEILHYYAEQHNLRVVIERF